MCSEENSPELSEEEAFARMEKIRAKYTKPVPELKKKRLEILNGGWLVRKASTHICPTPDPHMSGLLPSDEWTCDSCDQKWVLKSFNSEYGDRLDHSSWGRVEDSYKP